jgi:hypothetical protein
VFDGSTPGTTSVGGVSVGCAQDVDAASVGGADTMGTGGADDTTLDRSDATLLHGVPTRVAPGADDAPLGAISIEADRAGPQLGNDVRSPHRDLVVRGTNSGTFGHTTPGDTVPTPRSSGAMGLRVAELLLPGYPSSLFPPINWGQVLNRAEQVKNGTGLGRQGYPSSNSG